MGLILLRHTRPAVAEGLCYGRTDLPLDEAAFAARLPILTASLPRIDRIRTSPLSRCRRLAEAIGAVHDLTPEVDPRLIEMDFGRWETRSWSTLPRAELDAWAGDFDNARPHGGETVAELARRVDAALREAPSPGTTLWVTHAGIVRAACALCSLHAGWDTSLPFGEWMEIG